MIKVNHKYGRAPYLEILSEEQIYAIHSASLEILERIGMKCNNEAALKIFRDGGAFVNGDRVWIPPVMVEQALMTAPSRSLISGSPEAFSQRHQRQPCQHALSGL